MFFNSNNKSNLITKFHVDVETCTNPCSPKEAAQELYYLFCVWKHQQLVCHCLQRRDQQTRCSGTKNESISLLLVLHVS